MAVAAAGRFFQLWVEIRVVTPMESRIAEQVMSLSAVTPARACEAMIPVDVDYAVAE